MIHGFDTDDPHAATAALTLYVVWRSRDTRRFKVTPDVWSQVERFAKAAAKRSRSVPEFLDALKPRLMCGALQPRWMAIGAAGEIPLIAVRDEAGNLSYAIQRAPRPDQREFMTGVIDRADQGEVLRRLYRETAWIVLLVRDRLEREKPIEGMVPDKEEDDDDAQSAA